MTSPPQMQLVDWLDDLCVRFIINLPHEELLSVERICFQIEEAQWFYEDFLRPLDPALPSMNLRRFALLMFQHCPLSAEYPEAMHVQAYENFLAYKTRVPVRGAIMLNQDMTHAVLVKGWKKGAKWSFPRGKINKDEADLDCAVREVYEETGYDLKAAGLVRPEGEMRKIKVSMREQEMMLYVFRGVPMDTHFEPRTRKEISKIDWYRLTDLPTLKKNKHQMQPQLVQQGNGQDLIKDNSFYMVAPFLGPLKGWIKQQRKYDGQKAKATGQLAPPPVATVTDTELEADVGETTADEALIPSAPPGEDNLADLFAKLGRAHRASDALPEVTTEAEDPQILDPAAELKRLLSVGSGLPLQGPPVEAPAQGNPLLDMLRGNTNPPGPPRTPLEQFMPPPQQPRSPHGQHHPRPPHLEHIPPPPHFPFNPQQNAPFRGPHSQPPHHNKPPMAMSGQNIPPGHPHTFFQSSLANDQQPINHQAPRPYQRIGDPQFAQSLQFPDIHSPAIPPASRLPAPNLAPDKQTLLDVFRGHDRVLAAHRPPNHGVRSPQGTPHIHHPPQLSRTHDSFTSPQGPPSAHPYASSPPPFRSQPPSTNVEPVQPKPRSAHQDSLLNLFRSPSVTAATPPPTKLDVGPVELSAHPTTLGQGRLQQLSQAVPSERSADTEPNLLAAFAIPPNKPGTTSATVSGPVNVPDFETVKKHTHLHDTNGQVHSRGTSRGASPAQRPSVEQKMFVPQQILKRTDATSKTGSTDNMQESKAVSSTASSGAPTPQAAIFKPQILKRSQHSASSVPPSGPAENHLLALFGKQTSPPQAPANPSPGPGPGAASTQQSFDRRDTLPAEQKNTLLSLFGKPSQITASPVQVSRPPLPPPGLARPPAGLPTLPARSPAPKSSIPSAHSPQPPTPKNLMSGVISPVSPLPDKSSQQNSPANLASRSRISSIGDSIPPNLIIPTDMAPTSHPVNMAPTSHPANMAQKNGHVSGEEEPANAGPANLEVVGKDKGVAKSATSPVDKTFLLGFLENVAKRGR